MNWISGIQQAINYVEAHLTEDIDYEVVAKEAYSSSYHFQRVFGILCGYTLGDYIRMRRLSLAAEDLAHGQEKIIDIAIKYRYETPESFTRAFVKFHGITPSEAKRGACVKSFTPLAVKLTLNGGSQMNYRIEKRDSMQIICKRQTVAKPATVEAIEDITLFWAQCGQDGTTQRILKYMPENPEINGLLGICFSSELDADHFPYGIGLVYDGRPVTDDDLEIVTIPAHTYVAFTCRGKMPESFQDTYRKIVSEFFPQSTKYEYDCNIELEVYPSDDITDPDYYCEIWIAVKEK